MTTKNNHHLPAREPLERAVKSGLTYQQMAQLFSVDDSAIVRALKRHGLFVARQQREPTAQFALRFKQSDIELLGKLKIIYGCVNHSETIRRAVRKAAVVAGVLKEERE